jgi:hypothetical protein
MTERESEKGMGTKLPNGVVVFNATPHTIRFWDESWTEPVECPTDEVISASIVEEPAGFIPLDNISIELVTTKFVGNDDGRRIAHKMKDVWGCVVVGSIIAAQAYPGLVFAMVPCAGYERVPPAEKRMRPDKFTVF